MAKKKVKRTRSIITGHLEKIGAKVFDDFSSVITDLIKGHHGIYALFKNDKFLDGSFESNYSPDGKGRVEIDITLDI